ncbi:hypothetical protein EDB84DRAFT_1435604 [Lactarius hengduanensis]|nr:hypothetical protein EDB84DRAFT_1435604 [Lactarius hengduanensis]
MTQHWEMYDSFFSQRLNTSGTAEYYDPRPSLKSVVNRKPFDAELVATLAELESEKNIVANDSQKMRVLFQEMAQMCLCTALRWGGTHRMVANAATNVFRCNGIGPMTQKEDPV